LLKRDREKEKKSREVNDPGTDTSRLGTDPQLNPLEEEKDRVSPGKLQRGGLA